MDNRPSLSNSISQMTLFFESVGVLLKTGSNVFLLGTVQFCVFVGGAGVNSVCVHVPMYFEWKDKFLCKVRSLYKRVLTIYQTNTFSTNSVIKLKLSNTDHHQICASYSRFPQYPYLLEAQTCRMYHWQWINIIIILEYNSVSG